MVRLLSGVFLQGEDVPTSALSRLLDDIAAAIANDDRTFSLHTREDVPRLLNQLKSLFSDTDRLARRMASLVEQHNDQRTIRRADASLFAERAKGTCLYLVCCNASSRPDTVTELTNDMILVKFSPSNNGLKIGVERACLQAIEWSRASAANAAQESEIRARGKEIAKEFLSSLIGVLRATLVARGKVEQVNEIDSELQYRAYTLEEIARMCVRHDISFNQVVLDAVSS